MKYFFVLLIFSNNLYSKDIFSLPGPYSEYYFEAEFAPIEIIDEKNDPYFETKGHLWDVNTEKHSAKCACKKNIIDNVFDYVEN